MKLFLFLSLILSSTVRAESPGFLDHALPYLQYFAQVEKRFSSALSHCSPTVFNKLKNGELINFNNISPVCASELNWIDTRDVLSDSPEIKNAADLIVKSAHTRLEKIQAIYAWVTSNISYDYVKLKKIKSSNLNFRNPLISPAINTLKSKTGICEDYSLLTAALLRAVDIPAIVVYGKAKVEESTLPHAWNKAYLEDEGRWINMDATFDAGNRNKYFDMAPNEFEKDHIEL